MSFSADETVASASAVAVPHSGAKRLHHEAFSSISDDATPTATAVAAASCGNQLPTRSKRRSNSSSPAPSPSRRNSSNPTACHSEITNAFGPAGSAVNNMAPTGDGDEGETTSIVVPGHRTYSLTTDLIVDHNRCDEYPGIISTDVAQAGDMTQQQAFEQWPLGYEALADQNSDIDLHDLLAEFDYVPSFDNMWDSPGFITAHLQGAAHAAGTCNALAVADSDEAFATMAHHLADPALGDHQALLGDDAPAYCELDHLDHFPSVMGEQAFVSSVDYDLFTTQELEEMFSGGAMTTLGIVLIGRQCAV